DPTAQFRLMVQSGVKSVRVLFNWSGAQPYKRWRDVPADKKDQFVNAGGVPTDFSATDEVVGLASRYGIKVLPIVLYTPSWDARKNKHGGADPPRRAAPYANYL